MFIIGRTLPSERRGNKNLSPMALVQGNTENARGGGKKKFFLKAPVLRRCNKKKKKKND